MRCMLDKQGYTSARTCTRPRARASTHPPTHTPICNTYCFSTVTMVTWTRLIVTLYAHCLYCLLYVMHVDPFASNHFVAHSQSNTSQPFFVRPPVCFLVAIKKKHWIVVTKFCLRVAQNFSRHIAFLVRAHRNKELFDTKTHVRRVWLAEYLSEGEKCSHKKLWREMQRVVCAQYTFYMSFAVLDITDVSEWSCQREEQGVRSHPEWGVKTVHLARSVLHRVRTCSFYNYRCLIKTFLTF
jgi:hypothetical protein